MDWFQYWDKKAEDGDLSSMDRKGYSLSELFIYIDSINKAIGGVDNNDIILDIGGGSGYISAALHSFVNQIYLADFSSKMVERAKSEMSYFENMVVYQDKLPNIINTVEKKIKFSKIIVGSVIQYLSDYKEVEFAFNNLYDVLEYEGIMVLTHTPDIALKQSYLESFQKLDWPKSRIESAIHYENNLRFWFDFETLLDLSKKAGFSKCEKIFIPEELFQSTHMFDVILKK